MFKKQCACNLLGFAGRLVLLGGTLSAFAGEQEREQTLRIELQGPILAIEQAIDVWDISVMTNAANALSEVSPVSGRERFLQNHWRGTVLFHASLPNHQKRSDAALDALGLQAIACLEDALEQCPGDSTTHAMLAVLQGIQISRHPFAAIKRGPRLVRHRKAARQAAKENPRVPYLEGLSLLNRGGDNADTQAAVKELLEAEALFARTPVAGEADGAPTWGRSLCRLFLGEAYERLGNRAEALRWFGKALEARPDLKRAREGYERCSKNRKEG